jgi:hypothetical protein
MQQGLKQARGSAKAVGMAVRYQIYLDLGLVHVRYSGTAILDESFEAVGRYLQDPGYRPGQKQFVDLSDVTDYEKDYAKLLMLQAKKLEAFLRGNESLLVYYAPTALTQELSNLIARSWEDIGAVVPVVVTDREAAMSVLGLAPDVFDGLLAAS